ncbi:MAG: hypothetical protein M1813_005353 [Trichoglossum hirsutum]|nr:MAG: hypothetical protein M1813_005353 [Trichoglossum hirsutum]
MCQYRYHYYSSCRHQTFTVFSLCGNATIFTTPVYASQRCHKDINETPVRDSSGLSSSRRHRASTNASQLKWKPPAQNQALVLNPCQRPADLQQDGVVVPQGTDTFSKGKQDGDGHILESDAIRSSQLARQQQDVVLSASGGGVGRGVPAETPEYDHSWVEHYPLAPRIRTQTQSQEDLFTKGRHADCEGCTKPGTDMPRVSSLPSFLDADECHVLRSGRVVAIHKGAPSPLKTYKLKAKTPEWSDQSSSTSSLATFITAPESPVQPWSPNQERWSNRSPPSAPSDVLNGDFLAASTYSDATDHVVSSEADDSVATAVLTDSPTSVLTEKARGGCLAEKERVGNTKLSAEFLLHLVSGLSPESYRDIYQKYPIEFESLLRLRQVSQSSRITTGSSSMALPPPADSSLIAAALDVPVGNLPDDSRHEAALADARRGKKRVVGPHQKTLSPSQKQKSIDQEQTQSFKTWPEPSGRRTQNSGVFKSETERLRREAEITRDQQDGYFGRFEQGGNPEPSAFGHNFTINGPEQGNDPEFDYTTNAIIYDPAIIAQGQIVNGSEGRGKPTRRAKRKKYNRYTTSDRSSRHARAPSQCGSISESTVFNEFPELVSDIGHVRLTAKISAAQASPVVSSAGMQGNTSYYNPASFPPIPTPLYFPPLAIQNNIIASPATLPAWSEHPTPTVWMDYYGKLHSRKPAYPKCKWVGSEMIILPKSERLSPPGWTDQVVSASARRHRRAQHSFPQTRDYGMSIDYLRSPECSPSRGNHAPGRGLVIPPQMSLGLAGRASGRYERARRSLPTLWVDQGSGPEQLFEPRNRKAAREELPNTVTTELQGDKPYIGKFGARAQEEFSLESEQRVRSSGERVKMSPLEASVNQWNAQPGKVDVIKSAPHTPVEFVTGFLPCRKCEVTSAIEDFVVKCPRCDPDYQHESNPWS